MHTDGRPTLSDERVFREGFRHVRESDPRLRPILDAQGPIRFKTEGEPFESLVELVLSQQLAGSAASAIIKKVRGLFPDGQLEPERIGRTDGRRLRAAGVSPQKLTYLKDLSKHVVRGKIDLGSLDSKPDGEIIEILDRVKGIGQWTVQMFLIFTLGRPDVLPVDDYGIKTSVKRIYRLRDLPNKAKLEKLGEKWEPYRTVASLYLWRAKDAGP